MTTPEQQAPIDALISHLDDAATHVKALKAELDAIKQEAGEPVAWALWLPEEDVPRQLHLTKGASQSAEQRWQEAYQGCAHVPLYTRPAVPLTDEQIDALWRAPMSADWEHREFARAIEAAHGIKGA